MIGSTSLPWPQVSVLFGVIVGQSVKHELSVTEARVFCMYCLDVCIVWCTFLLFCRPDPLQQAAEAGPLLLPPFPMPPTSGQGGEVVPPGQGAFPFFPPVGSVPPVHVLSCFVSARPFFGVLTFVGFETVQIIPKEQPYGHVASLLLQLSARSRVRVP